MATAESCVVVADGARARFFALRSRAGPRHLHHLVLLASLNNSGFRVRGADTPGRTRTERMTDRRAGTVRRPGVRCQRLRLEIERRFAVAIAQRAAELTAGWSAWAVILVADPWMLVLAREAVRNAVRPEFKVKELAKDYSALTVAELEHRLIINHLLLLPFPD